ncbi:unnamed protein product [Anisakis simplex]|uniref:Uncharacterized protein n=1 Tax=Anisakis simplex TaxID=6269 RepID=A0A3P6TGU8_ANISI|nr:unnamed protein product [Anisakis simplex]
MSKNPAASDIMLKYIKSNADKVLHSPHLSQYLSAMIATWRTDNRLSQYEALVSEVSPKADEAQKEIFNEYRTNLKVQVDWHTRHYRDISA